MKYEDRRDPLPIIEATDVAQKSYLHINADRRVINNHHIALGQYREEIDTLRRQMFWLMLSLLLTVILAVAVVAILWTT